MSARFTIQTKLLLALALVSCALVLRLALLQPSQAYLPWTLVGSSATQQSKPAAQNHTAAVPATSPTPHIIFPKLNQSIPLTPVGLTRDGEMGVPLNTDFAGWYKYGPEPGQAGNAVIDGHSQLLGKGNGVFSSLNKLAPGDDIYIQDGLAPKQHFVVSEIATYDPDNAPLGRIFGNSDKAHLNLITCTGKWDKQLKNYTKRLVVYADLAM